MTTVTAKMMILASGYIYCCGSCFWITLLLKSRNACDEVDLAMAALHHVDVGSAAEVLKVYAAFICRADTSVLKM
jgi:hypothetical protein